MAHRAVFCLIGREQRTKADLTQGSWRMAQIPGNEVPIDRLRLTTFCRALRPSDVWHRVWPWGVLWAVTSAIIYVCVVAIDHPLALLIRERTEPTIVATLL